MPPTLPLILFGNVTLTNTFVWGLHTNADPPEMYEVAEEGGLLRRVVHRLVHRALPDERLTRGGHVGEVIGHHEHLDHRLVGVEQRLGGGTRHQM